MTPSGSTSPLTKDMLRALAQAQGLSLSEADLEGLLPVVQSGRAVLAELAGAPTVPIARRGHCPARGRRLSARDRLAHAPTAGRRLISVPSSAVHASTTRAQEEES